MFEGGGALMFEGEGGVCSTLQAETQAHTTAHTTANPAGEHTASRGSWGCAAQPSPHPAPGKQRAPHLLIAVRRQPPLPGGVEAQPREHQLEPKLAAAGGQLPDLRIRGLLQQQRCARIVLLVMGAHQALDGGRVPVSLVWVGAGVPGGEEVMGDEGRRGGLDTSCRHCSPNINTSIINFIHHLDPQPTSPQPSGTSRTPPSRAWPACAPGGRVGASSGQTRDPDT